MALNENIGWLRTAITGGSAWEYWWLSKSQIFISPAAPIGDDFRTCYQRTDRQVPTIEEYCLPESARRNDLQTVSRLSSDSYPAVTLVPQAAGRFMNC